MGFLEETYVVFFVQEVPQNDTKVVEKIDIFQFSTFLVKFCAKTLKIRHVSYCIHIVQQRNSLINGDRKS